MKIGIICDAHGNHAGMIACLNVLKKNGAKKIFFLGDAVGYMVDPNSILNSLQAYDCQCLLGNHDAMLLGHISIPKSKENIYKINESLKEIKKKNFLYMLSWKPFLERNFNGIRFLFVHGSPFDPLQGYVYPDTNIANWKRLPYDFIFTGHSHYPFIRKVGRQTIVNVGSCGLPRDSGKLVSCAICDTLTRDVRIIRIPIDVKQVIARHRRKIHLQVKRCLMR